MLSAGITGQRELLGALCASAVVSVIVAAFKEEADQDNDKQKLDWPLQQLKKVQYTVPHVRRARMWSFTSASARGFKLERLHVCKDNRTVGAQCSPLIASKAPAHCCAACYVVRPAMVGAARLTRSPISAATVGILSCLFPVGQSRFSDYVDCIGEWSDVQEYDI